MKRQLTHMEEVESELATSKQHVTELTASLEKTQQEAASAQDQLTEQLSEEKEKLAESQTETAAVTKKLQTVRSGVAGGSESVVQGSSRRGFITEVDGSDKADIAGRCYEGSEPVG